MEPQLAQDRYQTKILKERLTVRRLPDVVLEVVDEVATAVRQRISVAKDNGVSEPSVYCYLSRTCAD